MFKFIFLIVIVVCAFQSSLLAQQQYLVEYDKKADAYFYFQEYRKNGIVTRKALRRIEPEMGDEVKVVVKNVNEFVYKTSIEFRAGDVISEGDFQSANLTDVLSSFAAPGISSIAQVASAIAKAGGTRGDFSVNKDVTDAIEPIKRQILYQASIDKKYLSLLELMSDEVVSLDGLKKCQFELDSLYNGKTVIDSDYVDTLKNALVKSELNKENKEYISLLLSQVKIQDGVGYDVSNLDKEQLNRIKKLINEADFQCVAYNTIGFSAMATLDSFSATTNVDEDVKNFDIIIKFEKMDGLDAIVQISQKQEIEEGSPEFLQFFSTDKWRTPNGVVVKESCMDCKPLVLAEGYYAPKNGKIPIELKDLFKDTYTGHFGTWKFYDEETGNIKTYFNYPNRTNSFVASSSFADDDGESEKDSKIIETHYRVSRLNMKHNDGPGFSTCLLLNRTFEDRKQFDIVELPTDSVMIKSYAVNEFTPSIGVMAELDFFRQSAIVPSFNFGASLNVLADSDNQKLNIHVGGGLHIGKSSNFSILGGLSLCRTGALKSKYQSDVWYGEDDTEYSSITDFLAEDNIFKEIFKSGYYFGVSLKF